MNKKKLKLIKPGRKKILTIVISDEFMVEQEIMDHKTLDEKCRSRSFQLKNFKLKFYNYTASY